MASAGFVTGISIGMSLFVLVVEFMLFFRHRRTKYDHDKRYQGHGGYAVIWFALVRLIWIGSNVVACGLIVGLSLELTQLQVGGIVGICIAVPFGLILSTIAFFKCCF